MNKEECLALLDCDPFSSANGLYVFVGGPASGKSTLARRILQGHEFSCFSYNLGDIDREEKPVLLENFNKRSNTRAVLDACAARPVFVTSQGRGKAQDAIELPATRVFHMSRQDNVFTLTLEDGTKKNVTFKVDR